MNNKILARVVAALIAITMLGTVSFAYSISTPDEVQGQNAAIQTIIAVASATSALPADITNEAILDVQQLTTGYPTTLSVDSDRLAACEAAGAKFIVVAFGGNSGATGTYAIPLANIPAKNYTLNLTVKKNATINGTTYSNLVVATYAIDLYADYPIKSYKVTFGKYSTLPTWDGETFVPGVKATGADGENPAEEVVVSGSTSGPKVSGSGGRFTFTAYVLGVPANKADGVYAWGQVEYSGVE